MREGWRSETLEGFDSRLKEYNRGSIYMVAQE